MESAKVAPAALVVCNPSNPTGRVLTRDQGLGILEISQREGMQLIVDECYAEMRLQGPSESFLELPFEQDPYSKVLVLHTLSKRSGSPGLRSGFLAGDRESVLAYANYNRDCGVSIAQPLGDLAAKLWQSDQTVELLRRDLKVIWDKADELLGDTAGYQRPKAGFFLWYPVADDEASAIKLWENYALMVLPGRYLMASHRDFKPQKKKYIRVSLANSIQDAVESLQRLKKFFGGTKS